MSRKLVLQRCVLNASAVHTGFSTPSVHSSHAGRHAVLHRTVQTQRNTTSKQHASASSMLAVLLRRDLQCVATP